MPSAGLASSRILTATVIMTQQFKECSADKSDGCFYNGRISKGLEPFKCIFNVLVCVYSIHVKQIFVIRGAMNIHQYEECCYLRGWVTLFSTH